MHGSEVLLPTKRRMTRSLLGDDLWESLDVTDPARRVGNFDPTKGFTVRVDSSEGRTNVWVSQEDECSHCTLVTALSCTAAVVLLLATIFVLVYVYRQLRNISAQRTASMHVNVASAEVEEQRAYQARLGRLQRSQSWSPQDPANPLASSPHAGSISELEGKPGSFSYAGSGRDAGPNQKPPTNVCV